MARNYQMRNYKEFNRIRGFLQWLTCSVVYGTYYKIVFNLKVEGRENVPKKGFFIAAANHVSAIDPFLIIYAMGRNAAFMAKVELFKNKVARFFLNILGAFAVDRSKLSPSTIKTVLGLKKTNWCLGIFPQGTREKDVHNVNKGFAVFAKSLKCDILPVAIIGFAKDERKLFKSQMTVKIGKPIPYNDNVEKMMELWSKAISDLQTKDEKR